jgi:pyruvate,water dikinase
VSSAEPGIELLDMARTIRQHPDLCDRLRDTTADRAADLLRRLADGRDARGAFVSDDTQRVATALLEDLEQFRRDYGHRAPGEAELSTPRWREDDTFLWQVLLGYLRVDSLSDRQSLQRRRQQRREQLARDIQEAFSSGFRDVFRLLWQWTRRAARIRESLRDRVVESLDLYRLLALEIGRRMSRQSKLPGQQDVFYLRHDELADYLEAAESADSQSNDMPLRIRAIVRRYICQTLRNLPDPPNTFVHIGNELVDQETYRERCRPSRSRPAEQTGDVTVLEGLTAHGGRVEGAARVVTDPSEANLEPGDILVAPRTDVGWTPLFLTASAVVMELGGPLSHAAIVAREYDIPTIVNAEGIIDVVETGDHLVVDATRGRVEVHHHRP